MDLDCSEGWQLRKGELHDVRKHGVLVDDDNEALATIVAVLLQCICLSN